MPKDNGKPQRTRRSPGEGHVYEVSPGRYRGEVQYTAGDGTTQRVRVYGRTAREARDRLDDKRRDLRLGQQTPDATITVAAYLAGIERAARALRGNRWQAPTWTQPVPLSASSVRVIGKGADGRAAYSWPGHEKDCELEASAASCSTLRLTCCRMAPSSRSCRLTEACSGEGFWFTRREHSPAEPPSSQPWRSRPPPIVPLTCWTHSRCSPRTATAATGTVAGRL